MIKLLRCSRLAMRTMLLHWAPIFLILTSQWLCYQSVLVAVQHG
jgi:hypothetical protein